jgi:Lon protease-like protein
MPRDGSQELAVFPLRVVLVPDAPLSLRIFEPRYLTMVSRCLKADQPFVVTLALSGGPHAQEAGAARCARVGTTARIVDFGRAQDGLLTLRTQGEQRVRIGTLRRGPDGLDLADATPCADGPAATLVAADAALLAVLHALLPDGDAEHRGLARRWGDAEWVSWRAAELLPLELLQRQRLLECDDARERLDQVRPIAEALDAP